MSNYIYKHKLIILKYDHHCYLSTKKLIRGLSGARDSDARGTGIAGLRDRGRDSGVGAWEAGAAERFFQELPVTYKTLRKDRKLQKQIC